MTVSNRKTDLVIVALFGLVAISIFSEFVFSNDILFGTDMLPMGYMMRKAVADYWRSNLRLPLWDPYILCGLPVVDAMHGDLFYPASLFYLFMPLHRALGYKILVHIWLAGVTMYFLLRVLRLSRRAALLGGLGYMVAPYLLSLTYAGHDAKIFVTALFPLCVALLELLLRNPGLFSTCLFAGGVGLLFLTSHPQMAYFGSWGLGIYFATRLLTQWKDGLGLRRVIFFGLAIIIAIGIASIQFLPTYFYTTKFSPRTGGVSFEFASSWSLHPEEIVSLLYPSFVGYKETYWGRNAFKLNCESPGPILLVLAFGGFVLLFRRREYTPWLILFVFCPLYALGAHTPIFKLIYNTIPGAKFLRAPSVIMFMFLCSTCVLAASFIDTFFSGKVDTRRRRILTGLIYLIIITTVLFGLLRKETFGFWKDHILGGIPAHKASAFMKAMEGGHGYAWLLAVFGIAALGILRAGLGRMAKGGLITGVLAAGILVTSLPHSLPFIETVPFESLVRRDRLVEYILRRPGNYRVLPQTSSAFYNRNYLPIFGIETANGFYDNRIRYYEDLAGRGCSNLLIPNILRITNVRYVLTSQKIDHPILDLEKDFGKAFIYSNRLFLPRAFIVHKAIVIEDESAALKHLVNEEFDPAKEIILHDGKPLDVNVSTDGEYVRITDYDWNRVHLEVNSNGPGYVFFSENYLPYWHAKVDDRRVEVLRCDVSMRAIPIGKGIQRIEMWYESPFYELGKVLFVIAWIVVAAGVVRQVRSTKGRRGWRRFWS